MSSDSKALTLDEIKARIRVVCICKGIKMGRICDAIGKGADTVEKVNKACGSGNGGCGATRCRPVITELIARGGRPLATNAETEADDAKTEGDDDFFWKP
jgi:bacterioferritin-associated ferredoxin